MTINFSLILFLIVIAILFVITSLFLAIKINHMRYKMSILLEEKAKAIEEADHYAALAKNPLGPLFTQDTEPLILSFNVKGKIINANDRLLHKFGYTKAQLIGKNAIGTILLKPNKETDSMIYRLFKNPDLFIDAETEAITKSGETHWISWTNKVIYNSKGKPIAADAVGFDITKRKEMEAELQYLSSIDPQTHVMNRPALLETGATELKRAKRYGRALSVVIFKFFNKNAHRSLTDEELRAAAQLARTVVRSVDYLGRIGDVEFALILPETTAQNVPFLIQRLSQHMDEYNKKTHNDIALTYAAVSFKKKSDTIDSLISQAWRKVSVKKK
ncbi:MAG: diguanylate cyclase [Alphaproteobacteria bacterium]|nr:diguanylate cyclase [Alphaproteobacteria bacterium]